jgi:hypothetical protein
METIVLSSPSKIVFHINNPQFFALSTDLLTLPVPVHFRHDRDRG